MRLLAELPADVAAAPVAADDPLWDRIETEMVKLGSLAHNQLDLDDVAGQCLTLLESKTKDMRVLVQLLRCLQHPAKAASFATALMLLNDWITAYWTIAWPASSLQKQRLMVQILRRFSAVSSRMSEQATAAEMDDVLSLAEALAMSWQRIEPEKMDLLDELLSPLRRAQQQRQLQDRANEVPVVASAAPSIMAKSSPLPADIDSSNERAWRQTLLKVVEVLLEQQPGLAIGYRLRRHAIWHAITAAPASGKANKTQLSPVSVDRVSEYESALRQPDFGLWKQVEASLVLSPYWLEGHRLSARIAIALGFTDAAQAIADEVGRFLGRLPVLKTLAFSDGTPFFPAVCDEWLREAMGKTPPAQPGSDLADNVQRHFEERGLKAALSLLDETARQQVEPRERFYAGVTLADLLAAEGMQSLAEWHYQQLWQESLRLGLMQWEPGLVKRLEHSARIRG